MPEANETKKPSFPTVLVAGMGILVLALTAAAGLMLFRGNSKTTSEPTNAEPSSLSKADEMASVDNLVAARASVVAPAGQAAARTKSESGSPKSSTEDSK